MTTATKETLFQMIASFARNYGFDVEGENIVDSARTVNFITMMDTDWSTVKEGFVTVTYSFRASIAIMGGTPTGDELKEMGNRIIKAGQLINTLEKQPEGLLSYVHYLSNDLV